MIHRALAGSLERFIGRADRALRRRVPRVAGPGASRGHADLRTPGRVRARSGGDSCRTRAFASNSTSPTRRSATRSGIGRCKKCRTSWSSGKPKPSGHGQRERARRRRAPHDCRRRTSPQNSRNESATGGSCRRRILLFSKEDSGMVGGKQLSTRFLRLPPWGFCRPSERLMRSSGPVLRRWSPHDVAIVAVESDAAPTRSMTMTPTAPLDR